MDHMILIAWIYGEGFFHRIVRQTILSDVVARKVEGSKIMAAGSVVC